MATHRHGRHRKVRPKQNKVQIIAPFAALFLLIGSNAAAHESVAPAPTPSISPTETYSPTPTPTPTPTARITFATWNLAKPTSNKVPAWSKRRIAFRNTIMESGADVLAIQEASEGTVTGKNGKSMTAWDDVQDLAAESGFVPLDLQKDSCLSRCVHTARLMYRSSVMHQVDLGDEIASAGDGELKDITDGLSYSKFRQFSWGFLEANNAPGPILVISLHTDNSKSKKGIAERALLGKGITPWAKAKIAAAGLPDIPIVLMGDFNSWLEREPKGMVYQLQQDGWIDTYDSAISKDKESTRAYTTSYTSGSNSGWPKSPRMSDSPTRIDHIMYLGKNIQTEIYTVELHLNDDGTFNNDYRASDHMMVTALLNFNKSSK
jgi:endonuclease/exonuclease/phosphatase family metal-dependent hydrolase